MSSFATPGRAPMASSRSNWVQGPGVSGEITYAGTDGTPADRTIAFFSYHVPGTDGSEWNSSALFGISTAAD